MAPSRSRSSRAQAAAALAALQSEKSHQAAAIKAGCIQPLVAMLNGASAAAQAHAAQALANAAAYSADEGQNVIAQAGAVPMLLTLLGVGKAQMPAARALARLACGNRVIQTQINDAGGIGPLLALLNGVMGFHDVVLPASLFTPLLPLIPLIQPLPFSHAPSYCTFSPCVESLSHRALLSHRASLFHITSISCLSPLPGLNVEAQVQAAAALSEMACDNAETQGAIAKAGGIGPLLALLSSRSAEAQSQGMAALAQLARHNRENQDAIARMAGEWWGERR